MNTLTLISGRWMPSRLRFPLLFLLPLILLAPSLVPGERFMGLLPITQEPLASEYPGDAERAAQDVNRVATDHSFPILTDELEIQRQVLAGHLPTWNAKAGLGTPLAAGSLAPPWNPLRWPFFLMDPAAAAGWHALLSMALAGLGMLLFLEGRGLKSTAAFLGALAFQSSGFVVANLHYIMKVDALLWAPWCLWGVDLIYRGRKNAGLWVSLGLGFSGLAGFPQVFVFVCGICLAWILVRAFEALRDGREAAHWKRSALHATSFALLGLALCAVQWIPMAELAQHSARAPQAPTDMQAESLPRGALLSMLLPGAFGLATDRHSAAQDAGTWYWVGSQNPRAALTANRLEWNLFAGLGTLALALAALFSQPRRCLFPLCSVLLALGFAFGGPGLGFLYRLPGANLGSPARAAGLAAVGLAWLAAMGFDALLAGRRSARVGSLLVGLCGVGFGLHLWWTIEPQAWARELLAGLAPLAGDTQQALLQAIADNALEAGERLAQGGLQLTGFGLGVLLIASFAGRIRVRSGGLAGCLLLLVEASCAGLSQTTPSHVGATPVFPYSKTLEAVAEVAGEGRVLRLDRSANGVDEVLQLARPNMLGAYGIRDLTPYQALPSRRQRELWQALDPAGLYRTGISRLSGPALLGRPLLDAMNVTCVLSKRAIEHPRLSQRFAEEGFHVYARSGALGAARVVPRIELAEAHQTQALASAAHDFRASASGDAVHGARDATGPFRPGDLRIRRPSAERIEVDISDSSGGYLVMHEGWMPGWRATVNGEEAEVLRLDHVFFGVAIPPGDSRVRTRYAPRSLRLGATLSVLALLAMLSLTRLRRNTAPDLQHA